MSILRIYRALKRRLVNFPHRLAWELQPDDTPHLQRLRAYHNIHQGERCFILGNGPSINEMDLAPLQTEFTFGTNRIYLFFNELGFHPSYYVSINELVIEQCAKDINGLSMPRFINWNQRSYFTRDQPNLQWLYVGYMPRFSHDLSHGIWGGATVTYACMQIAYYMGFEQVILLGVDHHFETTGTPHKTVVSDGGDLNHFNHRYFDEGFRWQLPDLETSEIAYRMAKDAFEADGRQIVDATVAGKLNVYEKVNFHEMVGE